LGDDARSAQYREGRSDVVTGQQDVDDLLASLGF